MKSIELVIFNLIGTVVTDQYAVERCLAEAATETGLIVTSRQILAMQGLSIRYIFELLWKGRLGEQHPDIERHVAISYAVFQHILENHFQTQEATPMTGCLEVFSYLRQCGIAIALTTGLYRAVTDIILAKLGWLAGPDDQWLGKKNSLIRLSVASDEVERGRPYPYMIERIIALLNVSSAKAVVNIGDTPADLLSGRSAGVGLNLGVTNGTHSRQQLEVYPHDQLLNSLYELPTLLASPIASIT